LSTTDGTAHVQHTPKRIGSARFTKLLRVAGTATRVRDGAQRRKIGIDTQINVLGVPDVVEGSQRDRADHHGSHTMLSQDSDDLLALKTAPSYGVCRLPSMHVVTKLLSA
jgi:hypothetical protein